MACKRNAFVMLVNCAPELAVEYLESVMNQVPNFDELLQMAIVDLIRKDCKNNANNKVKRYENNIYICVCIIYKILFYNEP